MEVGFLGLLGIVFIILKLCAVIDWEWWFVLSPIWGVALLWVLGIIVRDRIDRL